MAKVSTWGKTCKSSNGLLSERHMRWEYYTITLCSGTFLHQFLKYLSTLTSSILISPILPTITVKKARLPNLLLDYFDVLAKSEFSIPNSQFRIRNWKLEIREIMCWTKIKWIFKIVLLNFKSCKHHYHTVQGHYVDFWPEPGRFLWSQYGQDQFE